MVDIDTLLGQYDEDISKAAADVAETLADSGEFDIPEDDEEDW